MVFDIVLQLSVTDRAFHKPKWVSSLPFKVRYLMEGHHGLESGVL